eukprot:scaffold2062_cov273-Chaetoceros_neogracile.AAC.21
MGGHWSCVVCQDWAREGGERSKSSTIDTFTSSPQQLKLATNTTHNTQLHGLPLLGTRQNCTQLPKLEQLRQAVLRDLCYLWIFVKDGGKQIVVRIPIHLDSEDREEWIRFLDFLSVG